MRRNGLEAAGGIAAQITQAASSLVLQLLAVRMLGLEGLGVFATVYGLIVLGAAVNGGLIGDSLTVLARHDPRVRAALQLLWITLPVLAGLTLGLGLGLSGYAAVSWGLTAGLAAAVFLAEDVLRRLLMASRRFWAIVLVDLASLLVAVGVLAVLGVTVQLSVRDFFLALAIGQAVAIIAAIALLPRNERRWVPVRHPDLRGVFGYGSWRALQISVKPALLAGVRVVGLAVTGVAAVGSLEAARLYLAPVLVIVTGLSSVMLVRSAGDRHSPIEQVVRSADRAALWLAVSISAVLGGAFAARPFLEPLITGGEFDLPVVALVGWAAYAIATGFTTPYFSQAAVRCSQRTVVMVRLTEAFTSAAGITLILVTTQNILWAPLLIGVTSALGGLCVRTLLSRQGTKL